MKLFLISELIRTSWNVFKEIQGNYSHWAIFIVTLFKERRLKRFYKQVVNVTTVVSTKQVIWGIYIVRSAVATGTVIEFTE